MMQSARWIRAVLVVALLAWPASAEARGRPESEWAWWEFIIWYGFLALLGIALIFAIYERIAKFRKRRGD